MAAVESLDLTPEEPQQQKSLPETPTTALFSFEESFAEAASREQQWLWYRLAAAAPLFALASWYKFFGLSESFAATFTILTLLLAPFVVLPTIGIAVDRIRARKFEFVTLLLLSFSVLWGAALFAAITAYQATSSLDLVAGLAFFSTIFALERALVPRSVHALLHSLGFRLLSMVPKVNLMPADGHTNLIEKPTAAVERGDRLLCTAGDVVPTDAQVESGSLVVLERRFGPSNQLRILAHGDEISGGSEVLRGEACLKVLGSSSDSTITDFAEALHKKLDQVLPSLSSFRASQAAWFAVVVFAACCAGVFHTRAGTPPAQMLSVVASVLLLGVFVAIPLCKRLAIGLALSKLFRRGILVKAPERLKALAGLNCVVLDKPERNVGLRVKRFEVTDERIDKEMLGAVILSLFSAVPESSLSAVIEELVETIEAPLLETSDALYYPNRGVCGSVRGVEFTFGDESLLVERGVLVQQGELLSVESAEQALYLAMGDSVVAAVVLDVSDTQPLRAAVQRYKRLGVRVVACSDAKQDAFDELGKEIGLELVSICGGLDFRTYREKLEALGSCAMVCSDRCPPELSQQAEMTLGVFDSLAWKLDRYDVTAFSPRPELPVEALETARTLRSVVGVQSLLVPVLSIPLAVTTWLGLIPIEFVAAAAALTHVVLVRTLSLVSSDS